MDLFEKFQGLAPTLSQTEFAATSTGSRRGDFLAKSAEGAPVFLIFDSSAATYTPGTTLKHLSVEFHVTCRIQTSAGPVDGQFALIACDSSAPELYELFVRCVAAAIDRLPEVAKTRDIEACVRLLLNLFRVMASPSGREIAGLWAELFVITRANDVAAAVQAWRGDTCERFDFSVPGGVLEVKATQGAIRSHEFSLEQLVSPPSGFGLVASLLLQPLTNGVGIMDLANGIDSALGGRNDLRQRLWTNIASALGSDFGEKLDRRFDLGFAESHLMLFKMADVPAPGRPTDARVSGVRFRSDLTTVTSSIAGSKVKLLGEVFSLSK